MFFFNKLIFLKIKVKKSTNEVNITLANQQLGLDPKPSSGDFFFIASISGLSSSHQMGKHMVEWKVNSIQWHIRLWVCVLCCPLSANLPVVFKGCL